jgi:hypothetical protein
VQDVALGIGQEGLASSTGGEAVDLIRREPVEEDGPIVAGHFDQAMNEVMGHADVPGQGGVLRLPIAVVQDPAAVHPCNSMAAPPDRISSSLVTVFVAPVVSRTVPYCFVLLRTASYSSRSA